MACERIYISGFMGSGKTTAGKKLASALGWIFTDLDARIEEKTGMKIPEIFSKYGEDYFRRIETEVLREAGQLKKVVISTGGGAPCHDENMDFMLDSGITVYLKLTPEQLRLRLLNSRTIRPLITGLGEEDLLHFIVRRLPQREQFYNRAEIIMEGFDFDLQRLERLVRNRI